MNPTIVVHRITAHRVTYKAENGAAPYTITARDGFGDVLDLELTEEVAVSLMTRLMHSINAAALGAPEFDAGKFEVEP